MVLGPKMRVPWEHPDTRAKNDENWRYLSRLEDPIATGTRWATVVIAASDSTAKSKATADYVCKGSGDQTVINTAVTTVVARAGTTGAGRIVFLEGTYSLSGGITINALGARLIVFQGMGAGGGFSTTIGATKLTVTGNNSVFSLAGSGSSNGSTVVIEGMQIAAAGNVAAIAATDMPLVVRECSVSNSGSGGGIIQTTTLGTSAGSRIVDNYVNVSGGTGGGIKVDVGAGVDDVVWAARNRVIGNTTGIGIVTGNAISTVPSYMVVENYVSGFLTGIQFAGNSNESGACSGNVVRACTTGIQMAGYRQVVQGNLVDGCTTGITTTNAIDAQYIGFIGNNVQSCTTAFAVPSGLYVSIIGNKASNSGSAYNIGAAADHTFVGYNDFGGATGTNSGTNSTIGTDLPTGGSANFVLKKNTSATGDFSWALDPAIDLASNKGDILVATAVDALTAMAVGRDQTVLMADSSQTVGRKNGPAIYVQSTDPSLTFATAVGDIWIDTT